MGGSTTKKGQCKNEQWNVGDTICEKDMWDRDRQANVVVHKMKQVRLCDEDG